MFTDVYQASLQDYLSSLGKLVWGSHYAEELELDRMESYKILKSVGVAQNKKRTVIGIDALREYLKKNEGVYLKISYHRGCFETASAKSYNIIETFLDKIQHEMGVYS